MIRNNVDIWAVLLLLLGFALYTASQGVVTRVAHARWEWHRPVRPIEVRISPFHTNRFQHSLRNQIKRRLPSCFI